MRPREVTPATAAESRPRPTRPPATPTPATLPTGKLASYSVYFPTMPLSLHLSSLTHNYASHMLASDGTITNATAGPRRRFKRSQPRVGTQATRAASPAWTPTSCARLLPRAARRRPARLSPARLSPARRGRARRDAREVSRVDRTEVFGLAR